MVKRMLLTLVLCFASLPFLPAPALAQDGELPDPTPAETTAADGLTLTGDYYAPIRAEDPGAPSILIMHMMGTSKSSWSSTGLLEALYNAGYALLVVDLRGHGDTGGNTDWPLAEGDVQTWIDWMRAQPGLDPERVNLLGASVGAVLSLRGMGNDKEVVTAVALSPVHDINGALNTEEAIDAIRRRPVFFAVADSDGGSTNTCKQLIGLTRGDAYLRIYPGSAHGSNIFYAEPDLTPSIVAWLDRQNKDD